MGIPRQEYCSGLSFHSPSDLLDPEIKPVDLATSAVLKADSSSPSHLGKFFIGLNGGSYIQGQVSSERQGKRETHRDTR